jgi:hypothetical protein
VPAGTRLPARRERCTPAVSRCGGSWLVQHGVDQRLRIFGSIGRDVDEQPIKQAAQRENIGGGRHRLAQDLFGRGISQSEKAAVRLRLLQRLRIVEQFRDAEIEQLDVAFGRDQYVARLEVAMHDELLMRARHRIADLDEQLQARFDVVMAPAAVGQQRLTVDQFEDQAGADLRHGKRFDEFRDAHIVEALQRALFVLGELRVVLLCQPRTQYLERHRLAAIEAARFVDLAHAAAPEQAFDAKASDGFARRVAQHRALRIGTRIGMRRLQALVAGEQRRQQLPERDAVVVVEGQPCDGVATLVRLELADIRDMIFQSCPAAGIE